MVSHYRERHEAWPYIGNITKVLELNNVVLALENIPTTGDLNKKLRCEGILSVHTDSHVIAPSLKSWYVVGFF